MTEGDYIHKIQGLIIDGNHWITEASYETFPNDYRMSISLFKNGVTLCAIFRGESICKNAYNWIIDNQKYLK